MSTTTYTGNITNESHSYSSAGKHTIKIDDVITTIGFGYSTIDSYNKISSITNVRRFGSNLTSLATYCFYHCPNLSSVNFDGSNITQLASSVFRYSSLISVAIPEQITAIGTYAFADITALNDISVSPDNQVFDSRDNCHALVNSTNNTLIQASNQTTEIPASITALTSYAFSGSTITSLTIPDTIKSTQARLPYTFKGCPELKWVNFPNSITSTTCQGMFRDCPNLISAVLPDNYLTTGTYTFYGNESLEYVKMPSQLTAVGNYTFYGCTNPNLVIDFSDYARTAVPTLGALAFLDDIEMPSYKVLVPESLYDTWKTATNWTAIASHIVTSL